MIPIMLHSKKINERKEKRKELEEAKENLNQKKYYYVLQ